MVSLEQILGIFRFIFVYVNPIYYFSKLDNEVAKKAENLSKNGRVILARAYLFFYLPVTFLIVWLTYTELLSLVKDLQNVTANSCVNGMGDCFNDKHVIFAKQNRFTIDTFIQVSFLMVGVIVGNVGWDNASKIKELGFLVLFKSMSAPTFVVLISILISLFIKFYFPESPIFSDAYIYRMVGWVGFLSIFIIVHIVYTLRKTTQQSV